MRDGRSMMRRYPGASGDGWTRLPSGEWARRARASDEANGCVAIGDDWIGHALNSSPAGLDATEPQLAVRAAIDEHGTAADRPRGEADCTVRCPETRARIYLVGSRILVTQTTLCETPPEYVIDEHSRAACQRECRQGDRGGY
jgi:hypothetical protein